MNIPRRAYRPEASPPLKFAEGRVSVPPIIKRKILAKTHLKKPKASGPKCVKAKRENGKEEAKKIMAVKADKYDFILLDIISS